MLTSSEIAWVAAMLEGEGSFTLQSQKYPVIRFSSSDLDIASRMAGLLGTNKVYKKSVAKEHYKSMYMVNVTSIDGIAWMMTIYTFMGNRRRARIKELINVWRSRR